MRAFVRQLTPALLVLLTFTALLGVAYPLATTVLAQVVVGDRADGSLIRRDGIVVGSELIGQPFVSPEYFHPRPSAAGTGYDGGASSGSNLGPQQPEFLATIDERVQAYRAENGLVDAVAVPVDAVTASGSGLDPHISIANARLQAPRVAAARGVPVSEVLDLVRANTEGRALLVLGEPGVDVLSLNLALDDLTGANHLDDGTGGT